MFRRRRFRRTRRPYRRIVRRRRTPSRSRRTYRVPRPRLPLNGLGNSHTCRLRYVAQIGINCNLGAVESRIFKANGLYDPEYATGGHQPMGFDQMMLYYNHYTVIGAKITMQYIPSTTAQTVPGYFGILLTDTPSAAAMSIEQLFESGYRTPTMMGGYVGAPFYPDSNRISKTFSTKKFFKLSALAGNATYRGNSTSDPAELAFFECWVASIQANDPGSLTFLVTIDYIALFTERKVLPQS